MEQLGLILILVIAIFWKLYVSKYKIKLSSPIFRNTETKELGCWASRTLRMPFSPYPGITVHDGAGGICKIREILWDKDDGDIITCHVYYDQPRCTDNDQYEHIKRSLKESRWKLREVPAGQILHW